MNVTTSVFVPLGLVWVRWVVLLAAVALVATGAWRVWAFCLSAGGEASLVLGNMQVLLHHYFYGISRGIVYLGRAKEVRSFLGYINGTRNGMQVGLLGVSKTSLNCS